MKLYKTTRRSHCRLCGKRLSEQTASGKIRWQRVHVDDSGIYCAACLMPRESSQNQKSART